jgi:hypothetical protein
VEAVQSSQKMAPSMSMALYGIGLFAIGPIRHGCALSPSVVRKCIACRKTARRSLVHVVLSGDCMLEQFALNVVGQISPNCRDRFSER